MSAEKGRKHTGRCPKIKVMFWTVFLLGILFIQKEAQPVLASGITDSDVYDAADGVYGDNVTESVPADTRKHVFVLASYELDWYAEKVMIDGISRELGNDVMLRYYFMDTKNQTPDFAVTQLQQYLHNGGLANEKYDAVIALDDNAFDFAFKYKERYFKNLPIVFCGVNSEKKGRHAAEDPSVTGVVEAFPIKRTIAIAQSPQPEAKRVLVIVDDSVSAQGTREQYEAAKKDFPDLAFRFLNPVGMTDEQMQNYLKGLHEDTILIMGLMAHGPQGKHYSASMAADYVSQYADIPVYKADEDGIGHGILGGCVISYQAMGRQCGKMVRAILNGKKVSSIPVETAGAHYLFDVEKMKEYHFYKSQLPAGTG